MSGNPRSKDFVHLGPPGAQSPKRWGLGSRDGPPNRAAAFQKRLRGLSRAAVRGCFMSKRTASLIVITSGVEVSLLKNDSAGHLCIVSAGFVARLLFRWHLAAHRSRLFRTGRTGMLEGYQIQR